MKIDKRGSSNRKVACFENGDGISRINYRKLRLIERQT